jgi:cell division protein YceG involved in septum cleavage
LRCRIGFEAILKRNFIYFCASVERFGYHEFAATLKEHNVNAKNIRIGLLPVKDNFEV